MRGDIPACRRIDDNDIAVAQRLDGMARVRGHNSNKSRPDDLRHTLNSYLEFALDYLVDFFSGWECS